METSLESGQAYKAMKPYQVATLVLPGHLGAPMTFSWPSHIDAELKLHPALAHPHVDGLLWGPDRCSFPATLCPSQREVSSALVLDPGWTQPHTSSAKSTSQGGRLPLVTKLCFLLVNKLLCVFIKSCVKELSSRWLGKGGSGGRSE